MKIQALREFSLSFWHFVNFVAFRHRKPTKSAWKSTAKREFSLQPPLFLKENHRQDDGYYHYDKHYRVTIC